MNNIIDKLHGLAKSAKTVESDRCRSWPKCIFLKLSFFEKKNKNSDKGLLFPSFFCSNKCTTHLENQLQVELVKLVHN